MDVKTMQALSEAYNKALMGNDDQTEAVAMEAGVKFLAAAMGIKIPGLEEGKPFAVRRYITNLCLGGASPEIQSIMVKKQLEQLEKNFPQAYMNTLKTCEKMLFGANLNANGLAVNDKGHVIENEQQKLLAPNKYNQHRLADAVNKTNGTIIGFEEYEALSEAEQQQYDLYPYIAAQVNATDWHKIQVGVNDSYISELVAHNILKRELGIAIRYATEVARRVAGVPGSKDGRLVAFRDGVVEALSELQSCLFPAEVIKKIQQGTIQTRSQLDIDILQAIGNNPHLGLDQASDEELEYLLALVDLPGDDVLRQHFPAEDRASYRGNISGKLSGAALKHDKWELVTIPDSASDAEKEQMTLDYVKHILIPKARKAIYQAMVEKGSDNIVLKSNNDTIAAKLLALCPST